MTHSLGTAFAALALYLLAAARITRFINHDFLIDGVRIAIAGRARDDERSATEQERWATLSEFMGCVWCVSIWVAAFTVWVPLYFAGNRFVIYVELVLAISMLLGLFSPLSADEDAEIVEG